MSRSATTTGRGPIRLVDVELGGPIAGLAPTAGYDEARVLVRLHGRPLGTVTLGLVDGALDAAGLAAGVWGDLAGAIRAHCLADGFDAPDALAAVGLDHAGEAPCSWQSTIGDRVRPRVTVVVTTCGGAERRLLSTVAGVLAQTYGDFEVLVVDNRPATSGVRRTLHDAYPTETRLRYAAEARPGLSHARNRGAALAQGEIVAFTDDDVDVDVDWLGSLVAGFDGPEVACVTGLILPLELDTAAQRLLEEFGGYAKGFARRTWDCGEHRLDHPLYPYTVGAFGSGANAAFRREALADIGGFDAALGAGTLARGGEDIDIYVTCVQRGYQIVYEPGAIVRHAHLREMDQIHQKVRDYGVGLGAMLAKHLVRDRSTFAAMVARVPSGARHLLGGGSTKNASRSSMYPRSLVRAELAGLLYGPVAYARSRAS